MIPRGLPDIHIGEAGVLPQADDEEDLSDEEFEREPATDDLVEILGFDPDDPEE